MQQGDTYYCFRSQAPQIVCAPEKSGGNPSYAQLHPPPSCSPVAKHLTFVCDDDKALASPTPRTPNEEHKLKNEDPKPKDTGQPKTRIVVSLPPALASPPLHVATIGDPVGTVSSTYSESPAAKSTKGSPRKPLFAEVA